MGPHDYVISADEKMSIQARHRCHPSTRFGSGRALRVEHEYVWRGARAYLAAWDVHQARLFGRCKARNGIAAFDRLVEQVMTEEPHRSARQAYWITDNGSAHRGVKRDTRLQQHWPNLIPLHTPRHASWLNQIEIYFSIAKRQVLTSNEFATRVGLPCAGRCPVQRLSGAALGRRPLQAFIC